MIQVFGLRCTEYLPAEENRCEASMGLCCKDTFHPELLKKNPPNAAQWAGISQLSPLILLVLIDGVFKYGFKIWNEKKKVTTLNIVIKLNFTNFISIVQYWTGITRVHNRRWFNRKKHHVFSRQRFQTGANRKKGYNSLTSRPHDELRTVIKK